MKRVNIITEIDLGELVFVRELRAPRAERLVWREPDSGMLTTVTVSFTERTAFTTEVRIHQTNVPAA